jgi:4'-phosphopantetheinyl transferase
LILAGNEAAQPRALPAPAPGVSLWWCDLALLERDADALAAWLSPAERARAARYSLARLARRYIAGRAALRWLLAARLGTSPADVPIARGVRGRPQLDLADAPDFNVSNTHGIALVGLVDTPGIRIGVDVEHLAREIGHARLALKFLTARERDEDKALDDDGRRRAFLARWTCKEAMSKATGEALAAPLRSIEVTLGPPPRVLAGPPPYDSGPWTLHRADAPDDFVATVALWRGATT